MTNEEREEALAIMNVIIHMIEKQYDNDRVEKAVDTAIAALKVNPCGDAVSREAVLNTLDTMDKALDENRTVEAYKELLKECYKELPPVTPKQKTGKWIPLIWDGITSNFPDEMDGHWALFTDGKSISAERAKKDAYDHFLPSGRWFEMSDAIAWMPLPESYKEGESE